MTRRGREIETLLLTMYAAVPLYFTYAIERTPILLFHLALAGIALRVARGHTPELVPARLMRYLAYAYIPFYFFDWRFIAGTAIGASTHLVLFIAVYQPIEAMQRNNQAQRLMTTGLIFVASLATSTHITVLPFVVVFALLMFRQLMYVSHLEATRSVGVPYAEAPSGKAAAFYLAGSIAIAAVLFPLLPRVRDPLVQGRMSLPGSSTALSESINFNAPRTGSNSNQIVARVWMDARARAFFSPVRLRGMIYDRYRRGEWRQTQYGIRPLSASGGSYILAHPAGARGEVIVQTKVPRGKVYLPVGTHALSGMPGRLYEGPSRGTYYTYADGMLKLTAHVATHTEPMQLTRVSTPRYPVTPEIRALAQSIVGTETSAEGRARRIENHLLQNYQYRQNTDPRREAMTIDDFLLRSRAGHCEYFAAGMVVLLTALDVPSRMAGGFYGGRPNPLTGYYSIRWTDAHAWTEVWNGSRWVTYDATPVDLRPGTGRGSAISEYLLAIGDSLNFIWDRYVLTFGLGDQLQLAQDIFDWGKTQLAALKPKLRRDLGEVISPRFLAVIAGLLAVGAVLLIAARRRGPLFNELARHLATLGIEVGPAMTIEEALVHLRAAHPDAAQQLEPLIALYEAERFSAHPDRARAKRFRKRLAELKA